MKFQEWLAENPRPHKHLQWRKYHDQMGIRGPATWWWISESSRYDRPFLFIENREQYEWDV